MPGDTVLRYDGRFIYTDELFHVLTREAVPESDVPIEYRRDGETVVSTMPAGAPGTFLDPYREYPDDP